MMLVKLVKLLKGPRAVRSAFWVATLSFFTLLILGFLVGTVSSRSVSNTTRSILEKNIQAELAHLVVEGEQIEKNALLKKYVASKDTLAILGVLAEERRNRSIGLMTVTDEKGTVISRTRSVSKRGDNILRTTAYGRGLAAGKLVSSIEQSPLDPTNLVMVAGRPVISADDTTIGALFVGHLMDDEYARSFRDKYLAKNIDIIFYTRASGIYGNSMTDVEDRKVIESYAYPDSDIIKHGNSEFIIDLEYGKEVRVTNVQFPGIEGVAGGVLIISPAGFSAVRGYGIVAWVTIVIFVSLILYSNRHRSQKKRTIAYYISIALTLASLVTIIGIFGFLSFANHLRHKKIPYVLYNSVIRLQPSANVFHGQYENIVSVIVDTGDEAINTIEFSIKFDPEMVEIRDLGTENSLCEYYLEREIDNVRGRVSVTCGRPDPGFIGHGGNVVDLIVRAKKEGSFTLLFDEGTQVLANDGLGTNVLRQTTDGSYVVYNEPIKSADGVSSRESLLAFSPTHQNSTQWYNSRDIRFIWNSADNEVFRYGLDTTPGVHLEHLIETRSGSAMVQAPSDGVYYFHVERVGDTTEGDTMHHKVMIDTTPPKNVSIKVDAKEVAVGDVVRVQFSAEDDESGMQKIFYVDLGNKLFLPVGKETYIPVLDAGELEIRLRVYDRAGNYAEKTTSITAVGAPFRGFISSVFK